MLDCCNRRRRAMLDCCNRRRQAMHVQLRICVLAVYSSPSCVGGCLCVCQLVLISSLHIHSSHQLHSGAASLFHGTIVVVLCTHAARVRQPLCHFSHSHRTVGLLPAALVFSALYPLSALVCSALYAVH